VVLGAAAAALASAGLVFWISGAQDPTLSAAPPPADAPAAASAPRPRPPQRVDAGQVALAYRELQQVYAEKGLAGVTRFSADCARRIETDPRLLDLCLAFDTYGQALDGDDPVARAWRAAAPQRDLALARAALPPGEDAVARLEAVRRLAWRAGAPDEGTEKAAASAAAPHAQRVRQAPSCGDRPTAVQRLVCETPALRRAEAKMRAAYRRALAHGANARLLARDQAQWRARLEAAPADRAGVARRYHRRTAILQGLSHAPRRRRWRPPVYPRAAPPSTAILEEPPS
jgi:hypothetical protein